VSNAGKNELSNSSEEIGFIANSVRLAARRGKEMEIGRGI